MSPLLLLFVVFALSEPQSCFQNGHFLSRGFQCDTPSNPCKVAGCSGYSAECIINDRPDGTVCPHGKCYHGECLPSCVGLCCDHQNKPVPDGYSCGTNMKCFDGTCVYECDNSDAGKECCSEYGFAKAEGTACTDGYCIKGKCEQTRDVKEEEKTVVDEQGVKDTVTVATFHKEKTENKEEAYQKAMKKIEEEDEEKKKKELELKEYENKKKAEVEATKNEVTANILKSSNAIEKDAETKKKTTKTVIIGLLIGVAGLALIAIIVFIIARKRKDNKDEEFYESTWIE